MKKILDSSLLGQLGVNLIERIVLNIFVDPYGSIGSWD